MEVPSEFYSPTNRALIDDYVRKELSATWVTVPPFPTAYIDTLIQEFEAKRLCRGTSMAEWNRMFLRDLDAHIAGWIQYARGLTDRTTYGDVLDVRVQHFRLARPAASVERQIGVETAPRDSQSLPFPSPPPLAERSNRAKHLYR